MKRYNYTVGGFDSEDKKTLLEEILSSVLPENCDMLCNTERSSFSFSASLSKEEQEEIEQKISVSLSAHGFELILPEGVETYSFIGDSPKKTRMIPLSLALSLIAAVMAITMLFSYATFDLVAKSGDSVVQQPTAEETDEPLPEYIEDLVKLDEVFNRLSYEGIDKEEMGAAILKAYIEATGDRFAEYMTKEEYDNYSSESQGNLVGIGVSIVQSAIEVNGYSYTVLEIISVFENSPAIENGVQVGDCIMYVGGGEDRELVDDIGYTKALDKMLGEEGTEAKFTVFRPDNSSVGGYREIEFSIKRRPVITESVRGRVSETDGKIGIIKITGFNQTTPSQFTKAVDTLKASGCEYFVFDMRNNPGGSLYSIIEVLSYFLDKNDLIVSTEYADGRKYEYYGKNTKGLPKDQIGKYKDLKGRCAVLVNENTASAAELFTATFRDYELAPIVGETTYGKGCMQSIVELKEYGLEGALRVTTAMYFSASHRVYHEVGIEPDYKVSLSEEALKYNFHLLPENLDDQLQKGIDLLLNK